MKRIAILLSLIVLTLSLLTPLSEAKRAKKKSTAGEPQPIAIQETAKPLQNPTTGKAAGPVWYHGKNLLQNPDASSSVNPPWIQSTGTWTVTTGPTTLGTQSIDTSDGSPWFVNSQASNNIVGNGSNTKTVTLAQTVSFDGSFFQTRTGAIEYGGDAFAVGKGTGNGNTVSYHHSESYEASYELEFLDSSGNQLAFDASGPIFNSPFGCAAGNPPKTNYGYRRAVGVNIPIATRFIRFTATMTDSLTVCSSWGTTASFRNGFDNLWLVLWISGWPSATNPLKQGSAPSPIVKATLTPKAKAKRTQRP